jgi:hypothetical protein
VKFQPRVERPSSSRTIRAVEALDKSSSADESFMMLDTMKPRFALYVGAKCAIGPAAWDASANGSVITPRRS